MPPERATSILIVEDERIVAKDLQQVLVAFGYDAFGVASSAEEAIAQVTSRCPDLVLMDIRLKGERDGIETAQALRQGFGVPVVYLTAHADDATLERAKKTEPHGYLVKPIKATELRSVVELSTYRHQMECRLRERERWFSTTLRSIADAVVAVDLEGLVTFINPVAERLLGCTAERALGRAAQQVLHLGGTGATSPDDLLDRVLREGQPIELPEVELLLADGGDEAIVVSISAAPVVDDGRVLGAVMVLRDITQRKKMQRQLEHTDRLAALGTMAAGVAHELNNPLAIITTMAEFVQGEVERLGEELREGGPGPGSRSEDAAARLEEVSQAMEGMSTAVTRMVNIVSDIRVFSRPTSSAEGIADVAAALRWALNSTTHQFRHRSRVITEVETLPPARGDESRLEQVFVNLLVNAAQGIEPGDVEHNEIRVTARTDHRGWAVVAVRDTGCGIAPDALPHIFEPFFTTKPVGVGTGLGLSICHGIIASFGGEITVDSQLGVGTTFQVFLPPAPEPVAEAPPPPPPVERRGRILAIDDEALILQGIRRILEPEHDVVCLESARKALDLLTRGEEFDVIVCDLMMPDMTGVELYQQLVDQRPDQARRVMFLTGGAGTSEIDDFLRSVPNLQMEKPFRMTSLREAIHKQITLFSAEP